MRPDAGRPQRFSAQLTLEVADSDAVRGDAASAAIDRSLGGYAVAVRRDGRGVGTAALVVRVPVKVQDAIARLSGLGRSWRAGADRRPPADLDELEQRERSLREQIARLDAPGCSSQSSPTTRAQLEARLRPAPRAPRFAATGRDEPRGAAWRRFARARARRPAPCRPLARRPHARRSAQRARLGRRRSSASSSSWRRSRSSPRLPRAPVLAPARGRAAARARRRTSGV